MHARTLQELERRAMRLGHPGRHAFRIGRKFEFDRRRSGEARIADRRQILLERRVAAPRRHVAVIGAIAIRHMHMRDAPLEAARHVLGRNAHQPEMRDVGPAVGLITALFVKSDPNEPIALLWGSDHLVREEELFR